MQQETYNLLDLSRNFLRQQYDSHAKMSTDSVHTHSIAYGLNRSDSQCPMRHEICNACSFGEYVFEQLENSTRNSLHKPPDVREDALNVIDTRCKMELYRGHRLRVVNQQEAIQKLHFDLEEKCKTGVLPSHAVVVMDWKMKFESMSARETTQQHFGKRGIGWHGFLASYYVLEGSEANGYTIYCDQIVEGTNKQDTLAVLSMLDAFLRQLHLELPFIQTITLQSDNAGCYQSNELLLLLPLISFTSPVSVTRFIQLKT